MKNQISLMRALMILNLAVFSASSPSFAAEFIQMKAQGYQPVVTAEEANRRVELGLRGDKMIPLEDGGTGRRTYLEKIQANKQSAESPAAQGKV